MTVLDGPEPVTAVTERTVSPGAAVSGNGPEADHPPLGVRRFLVLSLRPVLLFVASRAGTLLVAGASSSEGHRTFTNSLLVWDGKWYLSIAQSGYVGAIPPGSGNPAQSNLGFFPLLPILIHFTHLITRLGVSGSALLVNFGIGLLASVAVWWMLRDVFGQSGADKGTALVFFSPGALVLSLVYTEAATILLVACTLLALRRRRWLLAGLAAAVVSSADPVGSVVVVPCLVAAVIAIRQRREWRSLIAPVLAPVGVVTFFSYLWVHTGSPLEWFRAQRAGWQGGGFANGVPSQFEDVFHHGFSNLNTGVKVVSAVVAVGLLVLFFRAHPPALWVSYVVAVLALGILSPAIGITPRLVLRAFPLLGVVGAKLPPLWFEAALGLAALGLAALGLLAMSGPTWTP